MKKNKELTFDNLYDVKKNSKLKNKQSVLKIDCTVLQWLFASMQSRCYIWQIQTILLRHQLVKGEQNTAKPIRRVIESWDVPLPFDWYNFTALPENKADMAMFLSIELIILNINFFQNLNLSVYLETVSQCHLQRAKRCIKQVSKHAWLLRKIRLGLPRWWS